MLTHDGTDIFLTRDGRPLSGIVLAAGDGERLRPFTERWLGAPTPKQYCTFVGTRSMIDHTLDRVAQWCPANRIVSVVAETHRRFLARRSRRRSDGRWVFQPANRDTAAGVLLGLSYVLERDPDATVGIFPSDHFIYPEWRFLHTIRLAATAAEATGRMVLLGAPASGAEPDYGWIMRGNPLTHVDGCPIFTVESFVEKPPPDHVRAAFRAGGLWNTLVMIGRAEAIWDAAAATMPELVARFASLRTAIGTSDERRVLEAIYRAMPAHNFSRAVLECLPGLIGVMELKEVTWSDWGRPERIAATLQALGKEPRFSRRHLTERPQTPVVQPA
jgi:mannose-1-phosphate guanylyltransferase